jgi:hypothetical protein
MPCPYKVRTIIHNPAQLLARLSSLRGKPDLKRFCSVPTLSGRSRFNHMPAKGERLTLSAYEAGEQDAPRLQLATA